MRRVASLAVLIALAALATAWTASASVVVSDAYTCSTSYAYNTGCAVLDNRALIWTATGATAQPAAPLDYEAAYGTTNRMEAQRRIQPGKTGGAIVGGSFGSAGPDGAFVYSLNGFGYNALVGVRVASNEKYFRCIEMNYLACEKSDNIGTSGDPKYRFTITTRPIKVTLVNDMPAALVRVDGPYLTRMLSGAGNDTADRIASRADGSFTALRSVVGASTFAAVYKFARSADDPRYNAASVLVNVRFAKDGKNSNSKCTALYSKSNGRRFTCDVAINGATATVRVSPT